METDGDQEVKVDMKDVDLGVAQAVTVMRVVNTAVVVIGDDVGAGPLMRTGPEQKRRNRRLSNVT